MYTRFVATDLMYQMFKALGDPTRLRIFEFLRNCSIPVAVEDSGEIRPVVGATVGEVCCSIQGSEKVSSTISFHLKELRIAGLIEVERNGKHMVCRVRQQAIEEMASFFSPQFECCSSVSSQRIGGENQVTQVVTV
jgi:ArsR family transcriptional regulator, arsenate/arsenite/antimonite-responsive transcriptional repressor